MSCHVSPVLQMYSSTTKYYSRTTLHYKVQLQYYSVLQSTTPLLLQYYKVLLQHFFVLQSIIPDWSLTYETSFTMRGTTRVILQLHQILRLPCKMNLMIDPHHIWNVIYNARSNKSHPPTSPNTAPGTQIASHHWSASHMKGHLQCAEQLVSSSNFTKYCACHETWISCWILFTHATLFTLRGTTGNILQPHQILRLPRKMNLMLNSLHTWNAIYNARSDRQRPPTSPNTAPATKNEFHAELSSHMKRYLQCAVRQATSPNLTKYCACHEKWISCWILFTHETLFTMRGARGNILQPHQILRLPRKMTFQNLRKIWWKRMKRHFQCATDPRMIRDRSEHDPTMKTQNWTRRAAEVTFALARSRFYWKLQHFALRLSFQISPNTAPATKSDTWTSPNTAPATKSDTWTSPNTAPATKSDTWTSPNAAPATKSDTYY